MPAQKEYARHPDKAEVYNTYGPSETTVRAGYFHCSGSQPFPAGPTHRQAGGRGGDCCDGRKSGVSRKIVQRFTAEAKRRGTGKIHLEASQKGASLCRKPGFEALNGFTQFKEGF